MDVKYFTLTLLKLALHKLTVETFGPVRWGCARMTHNVLTCSFVASPGPGTGYVARTTAASSLKVSRRGI